MVYFYKTLVLPTEIVDRTFNLYAYKSNNWVGGRSFIGFRYLDSLVEMFIDRISKGRTVREFVSGVLLVPSLLTFLWMTIFGNSAIDSVMNQGNESLKAIVDQDALLRLFYFLETLLFSEVLSLIAILMVVIFSLHLLPLHLFLGEEASVD